MEPVGAERHEPRRGELSGESESIELRAAPPLSSPLHYVPGGNGAAWKGATWTKPAGSKRWTAEINRTFVWNHH